MKTVFSGIQPTGHLHLGNYLGSIRNWIDLQDQHRCIFGVMNLHAITVPQDPKELQKNILDTAAVYLACGLDPEKTTLFVQSEVTEHSELTWILSTLTPMGWLNRMTQFKDKANLTEEYLKLVPLLRKEISAIMSLYQIREKTKTINTKLLSKLPSIRKETTKLELKSARMIEEIENINDKADQVIEIFQESMQQLENKRTANLSLYSYPVLMASDILLYHADLVPVGEDQKQHLELTRDLAGAFNRRFGKEYFKLPEPMIVPGVKRIMSLQDGTKKMSKSDESDLSRINLNDSAEEIVKKVKKAKTDSLPTITFDENNPLGRPEIYNLLNIFAAVSGKTPEGLAKEYETAGNGKFKTDLAEVLVEKLKPIQENLTRFKHDPGYVRWVLDEGKKQAQKIATKTKKEVFEIVGL